MSWIHRVGTPWATRGWVPAMSFANVGADTSESGKTRGVPAKNAVNGTLQLSTW